MENGFELRIVVVIGMSVDERTVSALSDSDHPVSLAELRSLCRVRKAALYTRLADLVSTGRLRALRRRLSSRRHRLITPSPNSVVLGSGSYSRYITAEPELGTYLK